ncbi:penicillin-binding protein activator [Roseibacterium sp. KMU-115]|uniref:Penicillin-binding protein activator n=2 Tax=Roseicyclus persicicus TaxID=2650661 RepID=A0A7X6GXF9_9RHOB|nr:penicillin-binding protein activator [Roseibacterium persicicum]
MFSAMRLLRNPLRWLGAAAAALALAGCQVGAPGGAGPRVGGQTIQVAMLLPQTSGQGGDAVISQSLEFAARMAASELQGVTVEITVYDTAGQSAQAAAVARQAVQAGADVIIGPLRSDAAAAVGVAVANSNVSVLSFSNNTEIAGGNVFVLGHTFQNTAARVVSYAAAQGRNRIVLTHAQNLAGEVARDAVLRAAQASGATVVATVPYEFSQTGVINVVPQIVSAVRDNGANALMLTSDSSGALPFFAQLLPENGLDTEAVRMLGLTRWDTPPQTLELSGLQGGWFAVPDPQATADFNARYEATYGTPPHLLGALGYDAIRAVGETAAATGRLGAADLTASAGFQGANGVFRLLPDGTNERAMAIAQVIDNQVAMIDPAPRRLGGFGF